MHRDHIQYFLYKGIVASFTYNPIEFWEIGLPESVLTLHRPSNVNTEVGAKLFGEIKSFSQIGYEVFAKIYDKLAFLSSDCDMPMLVILKQTLNRDQLVFRDKVGVVQTLMTEPVVNMCEVQDAMYLVKKTLADSIDWWVHKLTEAATQCRLPASVKAPSVVAVDTGTICTEDLRPESPSEQVVEPEPVDASVLQHSDSAETMSSSNESSPIKQVSEINVSTKDTSDKKSVKTLLRELLPSDKVPSFCIQSPLPLNEHHSLPMGTFPLLVNDLDMSSVIGYSLVTHSYTRALDAMQMEYSSESAAAVSSSAGVPRNSSIQKKPQDASVDVGDDRENLKDATDKNSKCANSHIDVSFQVINIILGIISYK